MAIIFLYLNYLCFDSQMHYFRTAVTITGHPIKLKKIFSMTIIISLCLLLLVAYVFDLTASMTKTPSVILLLLGFIVREATFFFWHQVPDLTSTLPVLGTIGLILIVLVL
jgi:hypothetical protein